MRKPLLVSALSTMSVIIAAGSAAASDLSALFKSACLANGVGEEKCSCIFRELVDTHGEKPARFVALDMNLRYDEANALKDEIGEENAFAASELFDIAQNKDCSSSRLARLKSAKQGSGPTEVSGAAVSAEMVGETGPANASKFATAPPNIQISDAGVIDLREIEGDLIVDVAAKIDAALLAAKRNSNLRDFFAFHEVANNDGGVDTNGDGEADVRPGDETYMEEVQKRLLSPKLYFVKEAGPNQSLGEHRLKGGKLYAPLFRIDVGKPIGLIAPEGAGKASVSLDSIVSQFSKPQHLYSVFADANPDGADNVRGLGNNEIGFSSDAAQSNNDIVIDLTFTH